MKLASSTRTCGNRLGKRTSVCQLGMDLGTRIPNRPRSFLSAVGRLEKTAEGGSHNVDGIARGIWAKKLTDPSAEGCSVRGSRRLITGRTPGGPLQ